MSLLAPEPTTYEVQPASALVQPLKEESTNKALCYTSKDSDIFSVSICSCAGKPVVP